MESLASSAWSYFTGQFRHTNPWRLSWALLIAFYWNYLGLRYCLQRHLCVISYMHVELALYPSSIVCLRRRRLPSFAFPWQGRIFWWICKFFTSLEMFVCLSSSLLSNLCRFGLRHRPRCFFPQLLHSGILSLFSCLPSPLVSGENWTLFFFLSFSVSFTGSVLVAFKAFCTFRIFLYSALI